VSKINSFGTLKEVVRIVTTELQGVKPRTIIVFFYIIRHLVFFTSIQRFRYWILSLSLGKIPTQLGLIDRSRLAVQN
jgi:hypothetical protein